MDAASNPHTFGIEEEFFLTQLGTRFPPARVPKALVKACRRHLGERVTYELKQAQIEIVSPVFHDHPQASRELRELRAAVAEIAAEFGLGIVAASTHPLGLWQRQLPTEVARYQHLVETFQIIGRRDVVCGLHIHVAVAEGTDRVVLMNRLMPWLPLFLALSTSSPFWNRRRTGLLGYRHAALAEWPRSGVPDFFDDEPDYAAFVEHLVRAEAAKDASQLWWIIRPSPNFPTLELRVADACTHVDDALALAALFRCLVRAHIRRPDLGAQRSTSTRRLIEENIWGAQRYGLAAQFIGETRDTPVPVAQALDEVLDLVRPDAEAFGAVSILQGLRDILTRGTSAHEQLAFYDTARAAGATHRDALHAVTGWLLDTTIAECRPPAGERVPDFAKGDEHASSE